MNDVSPAREAGAPTANARQYGIFGESSANFQPRSIADDLLLLGAYQSNNVSEPLFRASDAIPARLKSPTPTGRGLSPESGLATSFQLTPTTPLLDVTTGPPRTSTDRALDAWRSLNLPAQPAETTDQKTESTVSPLQLAQAARQRNLSPVPVPVTTDNEPALRSFRGQSTNVELSPAQLLARQSRRLSAEVTPLVSPSTATMEEVTGRSPESKAKEQQTRTPQVTAPNLFQLDQDRSLTPEQLSARTTMSRQPSYLADWKPIDKHKPVAVANAGADATTEKQKSPAAELTLAQQREQVLEILRRKGDLSAHYLFSELMGKFEARAQAIGLPEKEVTATYCQLQRILNSPEAAKLCSTIKLAREVLRNSAEPTAIDQGQHKTCNVTSYECRLYARQPSIASKLVADVSTTGQFRCHDDAIIRPRTLVPDDEARKDFVPDGERNYASQIFQLTAINIYWNRQSITPDGKRPGVGNILYCQEPDKGTDREYLLDCSKDPPVRLDWKFKSKDSPNIGLTEISEINAQITGEPSKDLGIYRDSSTSVRDGILYVANIETFRTTLTRLKQEGKFPVLLHVNANMKPFGTEEKSDSKKDAPHLVSITDYDVEKDLVSVDNQWGKGNDFTGKPGEKPQIEGNTLFAAMDRPSRMGSEFLDEFLKKPFRELTWNQIGATATTGLTTDLAWRGTFGSYQPELIRSGLFRGAKLGIPGAERALDLSYSRTGRCALRGATALSTLALAYTLNDIHSAFKRSPEEGAGRLVRVGEISLCYELGALTGIGLSHLTRLNRWAPTKWGLAIGCGIALATSYDAVLGEYIELGGRLGFNYLRRAVTGQK